MSQRTQIFVDWVESLPKRYGPNWQNDALFGRLTEMGRDNDGGWGCEDKQGVPVPDVTVALRYNAGKPPLHLMAGEWQNEVARVMDYGARKYEPNNWRKGGPWSQHTASVLRHILAFLKGEDKDPESGCHHLAHAICGLFFVLEWVLQGKGTDDRYK